MSFIVNPLSYRLTKTKFSRFNWINLSKINYKKLYFEDKILNKFILWINFFFNWIDFNISIVDFNVLKFYKFMQINIKFLIRKKKQFKKKKIFKKQFKKKVFNFFFFFHKKKLLKNFFILKYFFTFKKKFLYNKSKKKDKYFLFFLKKKKKLIIKTFILNYFYFKQQKRKKINKIFFKNYFLNNEYNRNISILFTKITKRNFLNYFIFFFKSFLIFFFNNIFYNNKIIINILIQNEFFNSSNYLSKFIKMRVLQKYRVLHIVGLLFNNLLKNSSIIGLNIGVFGRYQKKLRNRKIWKMKGMISPSNINSPISYKNFIVLLRYGICGVKFYLLMKVYKNEIF